MLRATGVPTLHDGPAALPRCCISWRSGGINAYARRFSLEELFAEAGSPGPAGRGNHVTVFLCHSSGPSVGCFHCAKFTPEYSAAHRRSLSGPAGGFRFVSIHCTSFTSMPRPYWQGAVLNAARQVSLIASIIFVPQFPLSALRSPASGGEKLLSPSFW